MATAKTITSLAIWGGQVVHCCFLLVARDGKRLPQTNTINIENYVYKTAHDCIMPPQIRRYWMTFVKDPGLFWSN